MRHLIDFGDLSRQEWDELYARASQIMDDPRHYIDVCRGRVMASLFYEPSTRTNFSFQTAMLRLGGTVFGFADPNSSSVAKGETLKDTIKMVSGYADVVVMRTPWEGAAKAASLYSNVPVVNAGDGGHMHPTQTMADLTAITRLLGRADGLDFSDRSDLILGYDGRFQVVISYDADFDYKLLCLLETVKQLEPNERGTIRLNMKEANKAHFIPSKE